MLRSLLFTQIIIAVFVGVTAQDSIIGEKSVKATPPVADQPIEDAIRSYEQRSAIAEKAEHEGILPEEEIEKLYDDLIIPLKNIVELLKEPSPTNVYKFIEAKGIERVILPHLHVFNTDLRMQLLSLTLLLFNTAPTTTTVMAPVGLLDKLLEIFEDDDNLAIKARVVDIISIWLPDNPKIQARVMKLKGLEPFYHQVHKLDAGVIHSLLKLFNKILKEHIRARNENQQTKTDVMNLNIYNKIGLIERIASGNVCHGLLNIFQSIWAYSYDNKEYIIPVFDLVKNVEPFCAMYYSKGQPKAFELFNAMLRHMKQSGDDQKAFYENLGLDTKELTAVLQKYVDKMTVNVKDEF